MSNLKQKTSYAELLFGLGAGSFGAFIALYWHLPAGALVGSGLAVAFACAGGLQLALPRWLINAAFCIIGVTMGSGVSSDVIAGAVFWLPSLATLCAAMGLVLYANTLMLCRFFSWDRNTAFLASAPGALSAVVALAAEGYGDVRKVALAQSVRLLLLTILIPIAGYFIDFPTDTPAAEVSNIAILLIIPTWICGFIATKLRIPTAYLLAGLLISAISHGADWVVGRPPDWATIPGFILIGTLIGSRFVGINPRQDLKTLIAGVALTLLASLIACIGALIAVKYFGLDLMTALIAYGPGGVEGMGAIAVALNAAPALVAAHHFMRILAVSIFVPIICRTSHPNST